MIDSKNNNDKKTSGAMWVDKNSFDLVEHEPENPDYIKVTPFEALEAAQKRIERLEANLTIVLDALEMCAINSPDGSKYHYIRNEALAKLSLSQTSEGK